MNAETVLDIVLSSLLGVMHFSVYAFCIIWHVKKYRKGLHGLGSGLIFSIYSTVFGLFLPIGGFTFLDGGTAGTKSLFVAMFMCPICLVTGLRRLCFCIFIDGNAVVERILFSEAKVDLTKPGAFVDAGYPFAVASWIRIGSGEDEFIQFSSRHVEGDLKSFLESCKKILDKSRTETLPGD